MRNNESPQYHNKKGYVLNAPAIGGAAVIVLMAAGLTIDVLNQRKGPEASTSGVPASLPTTENVTPLTNEAIFADVQRKVAIDMEYKPTRRERMAFAKLGYAFNDGEPIPYEGDGKEDNEEQK